MQANRSLLTARSREGDLDSHVTYLVSSDNVAPLGNMRCIFYFDQGPPKTTVGSPFLTWCLDYTRHGQSNTGSVASNVDIDRQL
jgi:hypothetical protein